MISLIDSKQRRGAINQWVCYGGYNNSNVRRKISNVLIFNQAVADLVNCLIYGIPNAVYLLLATLEKQEFVLQYMVYSTTITLTAASSLGIFVVIAVERYLSISRPIWHKANVRKKHIWICILIFWLLSLLMSAFRAYTILSHRYHMQMTHLRVMQVFVAVLVLIVIIIYVFTFKTAHRSVTRPPKNSASSYRRNERMKRQIYLSVMFLLMFIVFNLCFIPIIIEIFLDVHYLSVLLQTMFLPLCLTSVFNPLLVLCFKREFRMRGQEK